MPPSPLRREITNHSQRGERSPLVGTLDLIERDAEGRIIVVDLKTSARKYTDLQADASLQLSVYSYATAMNGLADQGDLRLRFDVLTKTKQPDAPGVHD
jgi:RecB family exonuclease